MFNKFMFGNLSLKTKFLKKLFLIHVTALHFDSSQFFYETI